MSGFCTARTCIDVYDPVKMRRLEEWAESDAKFLRKLSRMTKENPHPHHRQESSALLSPAYFSSNNITTKRSDSLHERFAGRQRFLRSYTFGQEKEKLTTRFLQIIKRFWLKTKKKEKGKKNIIIETVRVLLERLCKVLALLRR